LRYLRLKSFIPEQRIVTMSADFQLHRNGFGQLVFQNAEHGEHVDVEPSRAFPISAAREGIALMSREGHELAWIASLDELPQQLRELVEEAIESREFMPEIKRVRSVTGYATPCTWKVETDRGETSFILNAEEDIRRITAPALLVVDKRGIQFLIRNPRALDETSRRILDHFL
jgi:hypothetical protein